MEFTTEQLELLFHAWAVGREGGGIVVADVAYPAAHRLAEQGWLARRFVDGELAWFWTDAAEGVLAISSLTDVSDRQN